MKYVYWYWHNYVSLAAMSLFVLGLLFFRKFIKPTKGLIISIFISYILLLVAFLPLFGLQIPETFIGPYLLVVTGPSFCITGCTAALFNYGPAFLLKELKEVGLLRMSFYTMNDAGWIWRIASDWVAFGINTLGIFAIIRLILYIKRRVSAKKTQFGQTV
jgi:hypothetical protein